MISITLLSFPGNEYLPMNDFYWRNGNGYPHNESSPLRDFRFLENVNLSMKYCHWLNDDDSISDPGMDRGRVQSGTLAGG